MLKCVEAGQRGPQVRSDCYVKLEIGEIDGIEIELKSKVSAMYGESIKTLGRELLEFFAIEKARLYIEDTGALPFVLSARIETAIRRALPDTDKQYLPKQLPVKDNTSTKERLRRSRLYLPGNSPKFMTNAGLHQPDGVILDLEDSVAPNEKDAARILVRNALRQIDFLNAERMVRINQLPMGLEDLDFIVPHKVQLILIPKCESAEQVQQISSKIKNDYPEAGTIYLMPIIESALGVLNSYQIATATPEVAALSIGLEDYTADIGVPRTNDGNESLWARCHVINSAKAAGIQAIDSVFSDVADMESLRKSVREAKSLGFEGKGCIHPRQIKVIHEEFAPEPKQLEKAQKIVRAFKEAEKKGLSVVALGSKMIDPPVVKRAIHTVNLAVTLGMIAKDWE